MQNKYVKLHSLLRMFAALLAIVVFIAMFVSKQVVLDGKEEYVFWDFNNGAFFGDDSGFKGNVLGFVCYILVLVAGLAGLAFVFIDELIGKDLTKKLSFVVGGVLVASGVVIMLFSPIFKALNDLGSDFHTAAGPIVFGALAVAAGLANCAAPILEGKGL